jgi:hypothetical protein
MLLKVILTAFSIIALGLLLNAGYEEWTGEAEAAGGRGHVERASKTTHPEEFRRLMNYQWVIACVWAGAAVFMWKVVRKHDSLDLFRPDPPEKSSREKP